MSIHSQAEGYSKNAESYARGRPEYPQEMVDWLLRTTGVAPGDSVLDLGAGTGKLTRALVGLGLEVTAIEPVTAMRAQLESALPTVRTLAGTAEAIDLADSSVDLVTCGQSFHWFANDRAVAEIARVLKPGHLLILVWNQRELTSPIQSKFEEILDRYQDPETPHSPSRRWKPVIDGALQFEFVAEARFEHVHVLDRSGVADRHRSMSLFSHLSPELQESTLAEVLSLAPEEGPVSLPYFNEAFAYRRRS